MAYSINRNVSIVFTSLALCNKLVLEIQSLCLLVFIADEQIEAIDIFEVSFEQDNNQSANLKLKTLYRCFI